MGTPSWLLDPTQYDSNSPPPVKKSYFQRLKEALGISEPEPLLRGNGPAFEHPLPVAGDIFQPPRVPAPMAQDVTSQYNPSTKSVEIPKSPTLNKSRETYSPVRTDRSKYGHVDTSPKEPSPTESGVGSAIVNALSPVAPAMEAITSVPGHVGNAINRGLNAIPEGDAVGDAIKAVGGVLPHVSEALGKGATAIAKAGDQNSLISQTFGAAGQDLRRAGGEDVSSETEPGALPKLLSQVGMWEAAGRLPGLGRVARDLPEVRDIAGSETALGAARNAKAYSGMVTAPGVTGPLLDEQNQPITLTQPHDEFGHAKKLALGAGITGALTAEPGQENMNPLARGVESGLSGGMMAGAPAEGASGIGGAVKEMGKGLVQGASEALTNLEDITHPGLKKAVGVGATAYAANKLAGNKQAQDDLAKLAPVVGMLSPLAKEDIVATLAKDELTKKDISRLQDYLIKDVQPDFGDPHSLLFPHAGQGAEIGAEDKDYESKVRAMGEPELRAVLGTTQAEPEQGPHILRAKEHILAPAIKVGDNVVKGHLGQDHSDILHDHPELDVPSEHTPEQEGFVTNKRSFIDRNEAHNVATDAGQMNDEGVAYSAAFADLQKHLGNLRRKTDLPMLFSSHVNEFEPTKENVRDIPIERVQLSPIETQLIDHYGTTEDLKRTGFLTRDGQGLDFGETEKTAGKRLDKSRRQEHSSVSDIMSGTRNYRDVRKLIGEGLPRLRAYDGLLNIELSKELTAQQIKAIVQRAERSGINRVHLDVSDPMHRDEVLASADATPYTFVSALKKLYAAANHEFGKNNKGAKLLAAGGLLAAAESNNDENKRAEEAGIIGLASTGEMPEFYSRLAKEISGPKLSKVGKILPSDLENFMKGKIKADELDYSGLRSIMDYANAIREGGVEAAEKWEKANNNLWAAEFVTPDGKIDLNTVRKDFAAGAGRGRLGMRVSEEKYGHVADAVGRMEMATEIEERINELRRNLGDRRIRNRLQNIIRGVSTEGLYEWANDFRENELTRGLDADEVDKTVDEVVNEASELIQKIEALNESRQEVRSAEYGNYTEKRAWDANYKEIVINFDSAPLAGGPTENPHFGQPNENSIVHVRMTAVPALDESKHSLVVTEKDSNGDSVTRRAKGTYVEEIQADTHQLALERGYATPEYKTWEDVNSRSPDRFATPLKILNSGRAGLTKLWDVIDANGIILLSSIAADSEEKAKSLALHKFNYIRPGYQGVANIPFKDPSEWAGLAVRRTIAEAIADGHDFVAFSTGAQQNSRWKQGGVVTEVEVVPQRKGGVLGMSVGEPGEATWFASEEDLAKKYGAENARKIWNTGEQTVGKKANWNKVSDPEYIEDRTPEEMSKDAIVGLLKDVSLVTPVVTDEGFVPLYDRILPSVMSKEIKKLDPKATVEKFDLGFRVKDPLRLVRNEDTVTKWNRTGPESTKNPGFWITDAMRKKVQEEGQYLYSVPFFASVNQNDDDKTKALKLLPFAALALRGKSPLSEDIAKMRDVALNTKLPLSAEIKKAVDWTDTKGVLDWAGLADERAQKEGSFDNKFDLYKRVVSKLATLVGNGKKFSDLGLNPFGDPDVNLAKTRAVVKRMVTDLTSFPDMKAHVKGAAQGRVEFNRTRVENFLSVQNTEGLKDFRQLVDDLRANVPLGHVLNKILVDEVAKRLGRPEAPLDAHSSLPQMQAFVTNGLSIVDGPEMPDWVTSDIGRWSNGQLGMPFEIKDKLRDLTPEQLRVLSTMSDKRYNNPSERRPSVTPALDKAIAAEVIRRNEGLIPILDGMDTDLSISQQRDWYKWVINAGLFDKSSGINIPKALVLTVGAASLLKMLSPDDKTNGAIPAALFLAMSGDSEGKKRISDETLADILERTHQLLGQATDPEAIQKLQSSIASLQIEAANRGINVSPNDFETPLAEVLAKHVEQTAPKSWFGLAGGAAHMKLDVPYTLNYLWNTKIPLPREVKNKLRSATVSELEWALKAGRVRAELGLKNGANQLLSTQLYSLLANELQDRLPDLGPAPIINEGFSTGFDKTAQSMYDYLKGGINQLQAVVNNRSIGVHPAVAKLEDAGIANPINDLPAGIGLIMMSLPYSGLRDMLSLAVKRWDAVHFSIPARLALFSELETEIRVRLPAVGKLIDERLEASGLSKIAEEALTREDSNVLFGILYSHISNGIDILEQKAKDANKYEVTDEQMKDVSDTLSAQVQKSKVDADPIDPVPFAQQVSQAKSSGEFWQLLQQAAGSFKSDKEFGAERVVPYKILYDEMVNRGLIPQDAKEIPELTGDEDRDNTHVAYSYWYRILSAIDKMRNVEKGEQMGVAKLLGEDTEAAITQDQQGAAELLGKLGDPSVALTPEVLDTHLKRLSLDGLFVALNIAEQRFDNSLYDNQSGALGADDSMYYLLAAELRRRGVDVNMPAKDGLDAKSWQEALHTSIDHGIRELGKNGGKAAAIGLFLTQQQQQDQDKNPAALALLAGVMDKDVSEKIRQLSEELSKSLGLDTPPIVPELEEAADGADFRSGSTPDRRNPLYPESGIDSMPPGYGMALRGPDGDKIDDLPWDFLDNPMHEIMARTITSPYKPEDIMPRYNDAVARIRHLNIEGVIPGITAAEAVHDWNVWRDRAKLSAKLYTRAERAVKPYLVGLALDRAEEAWRHGKITRQDFRAIVDRGDYRLRELGLLPGGREGSVSVDLLKKAAWMAAAAGAGSYGYSQDDNAPFDGLAKLATWAFGIKAIGGYSTLLKGVEKSQGVLEKLASVPLGDRKANQAMRYFFDGYGLPEAFTATMDHARRVKAEVELKTKSIFDKYKDKLTPVQAEAMSRVVMGQEALSDVVGVMQGPAKPMLDRVVALYSQIGKNPDNAADLEKIHSNVAMNEILTSVYKMGQSQKGQDLPWWSDSKTIDPLTVADAMKIIKERDPNISEEEAYKNSLAAVDAEEKAGKHTKIRGYRKLEGNFDKGPLEGKFVKEDIADEIERMANLPDHIRAQGRLLNLTSHWFKRFHTLDNPATHMTNVGSNLLVAEMSGVLPLEDPRTYVAFKKASGELYRWIRLGDEGNYIKRALANDLLGADTQNAQEFARVFQALTHAKSSNVANEVFKAFALLNQKNPSVGTALKIGGKAIKRGVEKVGAFDARAYQAEEELFKLATFIRLTDMGEKPSLWQRVLSRSGKTSWDDAKAAKEAQKWFFDYSKVSPFLDDVRSKWWGAPFITWQAKMAPRMIEMLVDNPIRTLAVMGMMGGVGGQLGKMVNEDDLPWWLKWAGHTVPNDKNLPEYNRRRYPGDTRFVNIAGKGENPKLINIGKYQPYSTLLQAPFDRNVGDFASDVGWGGNPAFDIVSGLLTNTNMKFGQPQGQLYSPDAPLASQVGQFAKQKLQEEMLPPLLGGYAGQMIAGNEPWRQRAIAEGDSTADVPLASRIARAVSGVNPSEYTPERLQSNFDKNLKSDVKRNNYKFDSRIKELEKASEIRNLTGKEEEELSKLYDKKDAQTEKTQKEYEQ